MWPARKNSLFASGKVGNIFNKFQGWASMLVTAWQSFLRVISGNNGMHDPPKSFILYKTEAFKHLCWNSLLQVLKFELILFLPFKMQTYLSNDMLLTLMLKWKYCVHFLHWLVAWPQGNDLVFQRLSFLSYRMEIEIPLWFVVGT